MSSTLTSLLVITFFVSPAAAQEATDVTGRAATIETFAPGSYDPCVLVQETQAQETMQGQTMGTEMSSTGMSENQAMMSDMEGSAATMNQNQATGNNMQQITANLIPCPGTGIRTAGPPQDVQLGIAPGSTHWYKFRYVYNEDLDDEPRNAIVRLNTNQPGCLAFDVQTRGRLEQPFDDEGDPLGPVGRGTPFTYEVDGEDGDDERVVDRTQLNWVGSSTATENYYVIVRNRSDQLCSYDLSITGRSALY
jgi:hypothetical protein